MLLFLRYSEASRLRRRTSRCERGGRRVLRTNIVTLRSALRVAQAVRANVKHAELIFPLSLLRMEISRHLLSSYLAFLYVIWEYHPYLCSRTRQFLPFPAPTSGRGDFSTVITRRKGRAHHHPHFAAQISMANFGSWRSFSSLARHAFEFPSLPNFLWGRWCRDEARHWCDGASLGNFRAIRARLG